MRGIPIKATHDELIALRLSGLSAAEIGAMYGCNAETIRLHLSNAAAADQRFGKAIGARRFEDVPLKPAVRIFPAYRSMSADTSLTGCAAALACV